MEKLLVIKYATSDGYNAFIVDKNEGNFENAEKFGLSNKIKLRGIAPGAIFKIDKTEKGSI